VKEILIAAGEISGDIHGSKLVLEMLKLDSNLRFYGIGGDKMRDAGVELLYHVKDISFLGFAEVVRHIPLMYRLKRELKAEVEKRNTDKIILIDYPGFNLSLAKNIYSENRKIYYYICPQIWAWGKNRAKTIKDFIYKMMVIFKFEEDFYRKNNINAEFVGHPLLELIAEYPFESKDKFFDQFGLDKSKKLITIFPGSRKQEIEKILPVSIEAAKIVSNEFNIEIALAAVSNLPKEFYKQFENTAKIIYDRNYELLKYSNAGIIKSGTSTLEAALFQLPFVVVYKTSLISYLLGKSLIKIDSIALANIVSAQKVVEELIQNDATVKNISFEVRRLLNDNDYISSIKSSFNELKNKLGDIGASRRAAELILEVN
jgi:lipid-A-disaccharide synthase